MRSRHRYIHPALPSAPAQQGEDEHPVAAEVEIPLRVEADLIAPHVPEVLVQLAHPLVAAVDGASCDGEDRVKLDGGIAVLDQPLGVTGVVRLEPATILLDVPLSH